MIHEVSLLWALGCVGPTPGRSQSDGLLLLRSDNVVDDHGPATSRGRTESAKSQLTFLPAKAFGSPSAPTALSCFARASDTRAVPVRPLPLRHSPHQTPATPAAQEHLQARNPAQNRTGPPATAATEQTSWLLPGIPCGDNRLLPA